MRYALRWLRSLAFSVQMYLALAVLAVAYAPLVLVSRLWAYRAAHAFCAWVIWTAGWMIGLRGEVRGEVPRDEVMIAAKHQSFFDIILIVSAVPRPKFIMKKELARAPFIGWYAMKIGCVPIDRGRGGQAVRRMLDDVARGRALAGQMIIYPQGTRVTPGAIKPYKKGTAALYQALGQPCVPVATNVGLFWPRRGIYRVPGRAVVEFLPRIPPGLPTGEVMARIEGEVEAASDRLTAEAQVQRRGGGRRVAAQRRKR